MITLPLENILAFVFCAFGLGWTICFMFTDPAPIDWEQDYGVGCTKTTHIFKLGQKYCFCTKEVMRESDMRGLVIIKS